MKSITSTLAQFSNSRRRVCNTGRRSRPYATTNTSGVTNRHEVFDPRFSDAATWTLTLPDARWRVVFSGAYKFSLAYPL